MTWPGTYLPLTNPEYVIQGLNRWWSADAVAREIDAGDTFIAVHGGQIVATSTVGRYGEERVIWKLYVLPEIQHAGVGSALIRATLAASPDEDVLLEFVQGNDNARCFYEQFGFIFDHLEDDAVAPSAWYRRRHHTTAQTAAGRTPEPEE